MNTKTLLLLIYSFSYIFSILLSILLHPAPARVLALLVVAGTLFQSNATAQIRSRKAMSDSAEAPSSSTEPQVSPPPADDDSSPPAAPLSPPPPDSSPPPLSHQDGVSENHISSPPPPDDPPPDEDSTSSDEDITSSPPPTTPQSSSPPPSSPPPSPPKSSSPPPTEAAPNPPSTPSPSQNSEPSPASPPPSSPQQNSPSPPTSTSAPADTTPKNTPPPASDESSPPSAEQQASTSTSPGPPVEFFPPPPNSVAVNSPPVSAEFRAPPPPISSSSSNTPTLSGPSQSGSTGSSSGANSPSTNNTSPAAGGNGNNGTTTNTVVGGVLAGAVLIAVVVLFFMVRKKRNRKDFYTSPHMPPKNFTVKTDGYYYNTQPAGAVSGYSGSAPPYFSNDSQNPLSPDSYRSQLLSSESDTICANTTHFNYNDVMEITEGFSRKNIIGEGGFGCVFKGHLSDGKVVAVKQLKVGSGQGDREFKAEVEIISRVHHRHLVSLVGYCISDHQRLLLYEFVPNKTLENHLHAKGMPVLDWSKRLKIAIGSAKGLAYLHEDCHPKIIHRDIKSANILLDDNFDAQVADFGLARLNDSSHTHVSTRVMGTFGYLAPEYASSGKLTDRSDVFSFGVVLLELVTGRKPVDPTQPLGDESLVEWARPHLIHAVETGDISQLVDSRLEKRYVESEMFRMIETAAACVRHSAPKRPRMAQVVRALDCDENDLTNGVKYGQSTAYDSGQYNEDILRFRRMAFSTDTSELDTTTSGEFTYTSGDFSNGLPTSSYTSRELETQAIRFEGGKR